MLFTPVRADITWLENDTEFFYRIDNQSAFLYNPNQYFNLYNDDIIKYEAFDPYNSVAETQFTEFEDIPQTGSGVDVHAKALGPADGTGPQNGTDPPYELSAQAFLSTVASALNALQGVDINLLAVSRVIHYLEVDQQEEYSVKVDLSGIVDFDAFNSGEHFQAFYELQTEVKLDQVVGFGEQTQIETLPGFPVKLDESNRTATRTVQLRPVDDENREIRYRIKIEVDLKSRIDNLQFQGWVVAGDISGNYQVGSPQAPFILQATIKPGTFIDTDEDGVLDDLDNCPNDSNADQLDSDDDGVGDVCDDCPDDPLKSAPGICGCDVPETDSDSDNTPDCVDECDSDPLKTEEGICGCGEPDTDSDTDGVVDCQDECPSDPQKSTPGTCGCGVAESNVDTDKDGVIDCLDQFPADPNEWADTDQDRIGNNADTDDDNDGLPDDWENLYGLDPLVDDANEDPDKDGWSNQQEYKYDTDPTDANSYPDISMALAALYYLLLDDESSEMVDSDSDGVPDDSDNCPEDANSQQLDSDDDGAGDACDECPDDADKTSPGGCGCGEPDIDTDGDGTLDCDEIDCSELPDTGCPLPPPTDLSATPDTSTVPGQTWIQFTWSEVECAEGYKFAIGTRLDLFNDPSTFMDTTILPSYRLNFSSAQPGSTYFWAVATRCNPFTADSGDWSEVQTFEFNN